MSNTISKFLIWQVDLSSLKYLQEERLRGTAGVVMDATSECHVQATLTPRDLRSSRNEFKSEAKALFDSSEPHVISTCIHMI